VVTRADPEVLEAAERAMSMALEAGASQAEALVIRSRDALSRFANSEIHQNVAEDDTVVNLRFVVGRRVGVASGNGLDDASLARLVDRAGTIARLQPEQTGFRSLPAPVETPLTAGAWSAATAAAGPEKRADGVAAVIAAADEAGVSAFGLFRTTAEDLAVTNSLGIRVAESRTSAQLLTVMMGPDGGTGYAESVHVDCDAIDAAAIGREAAAKARATRDPVALEPGDYPVVLEEYAVVDLADMLGWLGFSARAVEEGRSFFEPGRVIGSPLVTLVDDASDPAGTPASFDYEGVPKRRVRLIERGVCREVVHDAQTAARDGSVSTGHGLPAPDPWGPFPLNMIMDPGATPRDELVAGLGRGLLVTRFHYTNVIHPKQAVITGMTRDGLFLVEDGRIVAPVRNLRFTQSYLEALAGVEAVSDSRRTLRGFLGTVVVPAVRIGSFTFTGATEH
jgi:predicted Zn-dependent protease